MTGLDQIVKYLIDTNFALHESKPIIKKNVFHLTYIHNEGAAWGSLQGKRIFLLIITILILAFLIYFYIKMLKMNKYKDIRVLFVFIFFPAQSVI